MLIAHSPPSLTLRDASRWTEGHSRWWLIGTFTRLSGQITAPCLRMLGLRWTNYCKNGRDHVERRVKGQTRHSFGAQESRKGRKGRPRGL